MRQLAKLCVLLLVLLGGSYLLYVQAASSQARYMEQVRESERVQKQIAETEAELARVKQGLFSVRAETLSVHDIENVVHQLKNLPLQGGLEYAVLGLSPLPQLKLSGRFPHAEQFAELESYLKTAQIHYQIAHLHSNAQQQFEFELTIALETEEQARD